MTLWQDAEWTSDSFQENTMKNWVDPLGVFRQFQFKRHRIYGLGNGEWLHIFRTKFSTGVSQLQKFDRKADFISYFKILLRTPFLIGLSLICLPHLIQRFADHRSGVLQGLDPIGQRCRLSVLREFWHSHKVQAGGYLECCESSITVYWNIVGNLGEG